MPDEINLYISAAMDLDRERDLLGRSTAELPVQLGWIIRQSPLKNEMIDLDALSRSDVHVLVMGGDIRAPVGLEWVMARRQGQQPILYLKSGIHRTAAAQEYIRFVGGPASWLQFRDGAELRFLFLSHLVKHILDRGSYYSLSQPEIDRLLSWHKKLKKTQSEASLEFPGGAGKSGRIYSTERYMPSEGILLEPAEDESPEE
jgi:hypothetical protein